MSDTMSPVIVYDGNCGFCRAAIRFLVPRLAPAGVVQPWQGADLTTYGLTEDQARARMWFVQGGQRHGGAAAFTAWARTGNAAARAAGRLLSLPGITRVAAGAYWLVARKRHRIPGPWEHTRTL
ncbi:thiol-disulfide oxidoreductase DCC family protein [Kitasatospora purpeofusca]|uniref:thiol-disulfide oxidoreductase DCC family protein n=1 Tax=Kitasatospora purpeofusca TaxID=67352 RepID=UPI0036E19A63